MALSARIISVHEQRLNTLLQQFDQASGRIQSQISENNDETLNSLRTVLDSALLLVSRSQPEALESNAPQSMLWSLLAVVSIPRPTRSVTDFRSACEMLSGSCDQLCGAADQARQILNLIQREMLELEDQVTNLHQQLQDESVKSQQELERKQADLREKALELQFAQQQFEKQMVEGRRLDHRRENVKDARIGVRFLRAAAWIGTVGTGGLLLPVAVAAEGAGMVMKHKKEKYDTLVLHQRSIESTHEQAVENANTEVVHLEMATKVFEPLIAKCTMLIYRARQAKTRISTNTREYDEMKAVAIRFSQFTKQLQSQAHMSMMVEDDAEFRPYLDNLTGMLQAKVKEISMVRTGTLLLNNLQVQ